VLSEHLIRLAGFDVLTLATGLVWPPETGPGEGALVLCLDLLSNILSDISLPETYAGDVKG
jgi:hypothetical protein